MITRRTFLNTAIAGSFSSMLPSLNLSMANPVMKKQPNVLFIIADDMNDYGFYGTYPDVKMPYLHTFKKTALTFEKAYCAAPACIPSRAALFSGLYPYNTGSYLNGSDPWNHSPFIEIEAMPECFKRNGYTTFGRGKLFHSEPPAKRKKAMWDNEAWGGGFGPFPSEANQSEGEFGKFWGCEAIEDDQQFPDVKNAEAIIEFFKQEHKNPFFIVYGLWRPHTPFTAPKRFFEMYDPGNFQIPIPSWSNDDLKDVPPLGRKLAEVFGKRYDLCGENNPEKWRQFVHGYFATTSFADWSAGRVIEALDSSPYKDNTMIIFLSDNGYHCGEKNHWEKNTLWEQAALTPMAIRFPQMTHARVCVQPVGSIDLFPTLVDYCNLQPPKTHNLDGENLRPLLEKPDTPWHRPAITTYGEGYFSARNLQFRYIRYPDGTEELYDHEKDPHEFKNLSLNLEYGNVKKDFEKWIPEQWARSLGGRLG